MRVDDFKTGYSCLEVVTLPTEHNPCDPSPCGPNTLCRDGICSCLPQYQGDPYTGCRPECTMNTDCSPNKACSNLKCIDPCPGTCGQNAACDVVNHIPTCSCPPNLQGDPFVLCKEVIPIGMCFTKAYDVADFTIDLFQCLYNHVIHRPVDQTVCAG